MKFYAIFEEFSMAMRAVEILLDHKVLLHQLSLITDPEMKGPARTERLDSLSIAGFGRIWGLGELSQAAAVKAGTSADGRIGGGLATVLCGAQVPVQAMEACVQALASGGAVLEVVTTQGETDPDAIEHLLGKYGATMTAAIGESEVL